MIVLFNLKFLQVEADSQALQGVGNWFNSLEKRVNIQEMTNEVQGKDRNIAKKILEYPGRIFEQGTGSLPNSNDNNEDTDITDLVNSQEMAELYSATSFETRASEVSSDEVKSEPDTEMVTELQRKPKKKKKIKKHKKNHRKKHQPVVQMEQRTVTGAETDKAEFGNIAYKIHNHNTPHHSIHKKKFVKKAIKDGSNNSESDEDKKTKPVDIIVHIKMND
ncbi:hypothetical protein HF086_008183 [Spodoptera exigua]|uniref:Uncharacterized protein n=1 Tax=Spodoptera exigua TaxID=7107 RepID=A0A922M3X9_SPOEX|nr:hypothetical protein HF086_008183 [Spodoptera exigua]